MKVLVVDDNEAAADLLAELLADEHAVRVVYSSAQACNAVLEETFDVALVDIKPRNAPGNMLAGQLRHALPALVLVAVTASSVQDIQDDPAFAMAFSCILQKPIHFEELAIYLRTLGGRQEAFRSTDANGLALTRAS